MIAVYAETSGHGAPRGALDLTRLMINNRSMKLNLYDLKANFSKYIEMVEAGETVVVCKRNVPVAEIRPIASPSKKVPELGWAEGRLKEAGDFGDIPPEIQAAFQGDADDPLKKYMPAAKRSRRKK